MIYRQCAALLRHNQSSFQAILIALALTALSACDGTSVIDVSIAGDSPGVASVVVTDVIDDEATVDWNLTSGAFAEQWNLYQNNLRVCSGTPLTVAASDDSPSYQTGGCTIALQEGSNSFQVQLCNADSSQCSSSATEVIDYQEPTELGAIAWQDLPGSETTESQHYLSWSKGEGLNGDYWHIYQDDAVACSGTLSYSAALGAQSAGCDVTLDLGANSFQAQLCQTQPVGIDDNCVQSSLVSLTFSTDPERILATPIIEELDESLPANYDTTISWSKDTSSGSAGEDWNLSNHGAVICQGVLADGANGASCSVQLVEGSNNLQVRLCTAVETYSGASCDYSATVAVDGFDPEPLTPGTITITDSLPAQVSDAPSVVVDWQIASGNGVSSWSVFGNDDLYCDTANADEYYWSGSCPIALESGTNTISVTGCNYGYADSESCATSSEVEVEYITVPGTPELTTSLPATTYLSEHNLSWELTEGEAADYWLAMVNDISQCSDDLAQLTPQSGSCIVELDSGVNLIAVRLCVANESGSAYCSDSETEQVELLAPVPSQPAITTPEQSIADDIILLEWSKSGGDNGSYWSLSNNGALVAACADQPLLSIGSSQSGYCNLPLELGANLISVSLCNDNAAGTTSCSTSESITITRESAAPEFTSGTSASVAENTSTVFYTATVTDNDSSQEQLSFALSGADSSWFSIDSSGGLAFVSAADYEAPQDANGDNTYQLSLRVTDETELYDQLELSISVSNVNDAAPEFTSAAAVSVAENSSGVVHTIQASDAEGDTISYSLAGTDADSFSLDSSSGALSFFSPPNYEDAQDHDQDNTYELSIIATDGSNSTSQDIAIAVKDSNEAPSFSTSSVSLTTAENNASFVYAVEAASDEDSGQQLSYQLTGTDQSAFSLDASTLKLSFRAPPNYEAPSDQDTNNDYQISISASDGEYATSQDIVISVTNLNDEAPQFTSVTSLALAYADVTLGATIYTAASIDADANDATSYALSGAQAISFSLDPSSGELAFSQLPAQEDLPQDGGITYDLIITATDLGGNSTDLGLSINLLEIIGSAPEFAQASVSLSVAENTTASLHQAAATDADGDTIAYSLTGIDSSLFTIDSGSGELGFNSPPDYEQPLDSDLDNTYDLTITATDPIGNQAQQSLTVTIDNLNDNSPQFDLTADSFAIAENTSAVTTITASDADNDTLTLSLVVFDDSSFFSLDSSSGALAFQQAPDFETAQDSNSDNTYEIELSVSDGSHTTSASISVTVTNVDEAPSFAADNQSLSVNENTSGSLYTAAASDPEQANLTYSASGTDASLFTIGSSSGELSFKSIPDFEIPLDQGADNTYQLDITASDGGNSVSQALSITVANVNEPHSFAATSVSLDTSENNSSFTYTVEAASDPDSGSALTYQLTGDDQAAFNFDPDTRKLSFKTKPDYETPADQNSDNLYQVDITATDSDYSASQSITISVSDLNDEAPQFTSLGSQAVNYSTVQVGDIVYTATSTDLDAGDQVSYALSGADASSFTFDASGGALAFAQLPSLTEFQSSNGGIAYALTITATDLAGNSSVLDLTVNLVDDTGSAPVFAQASANITVDENVVGIIYQAAASDADGDPVAYSLAGADAVVFTIDPSSGELSFQAPPDYEQPLDSDLDNTYELTIVATDPVGNQGSQSLAIAITNLNDNSPQLDLTANSFTIAENTSAVTTITASDADNDTLTLALVVSDDSSFFSLDSSSGALAFTSAPDFETAQDSNSDNTYEIELSVSDGSNTTSASISVTVTNVDEAPSFAATTQDLLVSENASGSLYTAAASDPEQANLTYSASGTDASLFTIGSSSGELSFKSIPDFETPLDQGADNIYQLDITASDGSNSVSQALSITVTNVNEPHSFAATSVSLGTSENNSSFTYTVEAASDPDSGSALTYQLTGDDQAAFNFDPDTRELSFKTNPDYESPVDQDNDNTYQISISAFDADHSASQNISISVSDLNDEAPQFTSLGSQAVNYSTVQVGDIVYTATSTDLDAGDQVSYALSGADASHFTFDASSGALAFAQLPSLSEFQSSNGGIAYALTITATDLANNSSVLGLTINLVDDTGSAPVFAQDSTSIDVDENSAGSVYTAQATDADPGDTLAYSISGSDAALFTIDPSSGELAFNTAPDYEQPLDSDLDNTYELTIVATDPVGNQGSQSLAIAITNLNDNSPQLDLTANSFAIAENTSAVTTIIASDADNDTLTLALVVSDDSSFFSLDSSSGALAFTSAPDFETAQDSNSDNTYEIELGVSDGSNTTSASISVTVTNVDEAPSFAADNQSLSVNENTSGSLYTAAASDPEQANLTYSASGIDASLFTIGSSSGELSFKSIPDFETPLDQGADNIYQLDITASDGGNSVSQALSITVTNVNEPHSFAATSISLSTSENNSSFTYTVDAADDPDSGPALTYQLTGDDQSAFNFDPDTRELSFKTNPDYESPADQNSDNLYQIDITATDSDHSASQNITISVSDLNDEAPQFTSLSSQAVNYSTVQVGDIVYTATSTDLDAGDQVSYALSGADASSFTFDASGGALAFAQLPSLSEFQSSNGGIAYSLTITATDLANNSSVLDLTINLVDDTGSAPVFAQASVSINVDENSAGSVYTAQATDADPGDTLAYSISGSDAALFTIDSSSGDLAFNAAPDFENPSDDGQDNTYDLTITATDAIGKQASQSLALTVTNVNEAPSFAATSVNLNADENDLSFTHIVDAADDPDQGETLTYQLAGDDQSAFNFDPDTRVLSFQQAPDFESPADQDLDNIYQIDITATDGDYSTTQAITITVANVEESPYFHSTTDHVEIAEDPATEGTASPVLALTIQAADDEDDLAGTSLNFVISGGADSDKFSLTAVDANSADLSFSISPDFDNPHDANLDSNYSLSIQVADSSGASEQHDLIVQVLGINDEVPQLTSAASADVNENSTAVFYTATATDADRSDWSDSDPSKRYQPNLDSITFSLDSANYPDSSFFSIDASSGELQATSGLNYENPQSSAQSNSYSVAIELADSAANSSVDIITVSVIDDPNEPEPIDYAAPQIPWFYSDVNVGESIDIPWIIYSGDGAIAWSLLVNGATVCSESASISDPVTSGVCSVSSSHLTSGSALNATAVSVTYSDSSSQLSEEVTFAYAASSAINFPAPSSNQDATACAGVDIGDPVNATSNSACYDYLLGDDDFGGPHDQVPSYLDPANGRDFEVIAYFIEWGIYSRDFHPADLPANLLSTALFSFVKLKDDNSSDPNCETCSFTGEVDLADGWAALSKSYATDAWCDINYDDWTVDSACKGNGIFKQFWLLKQKFPHLKTCVSVGGWSFSRPFPLVGESATMRAIFADSIVDMAEKYHFDCIDIDWEFPIIGGGDYKVTDASGNPSYDYDLDGNTPFLAPSDNDAQYFANLIQELRSEIDSRGLAIDINSAMYAGDYGMSKMDYNLFAGNLHGIHMMTYDFYGAWDPYTGMQAALFPNSDPLSNEVALQYPSAYNNQHNIASAMARAVNNAIDNGFESNTKMRRKIVPGLAFYGRNYSGVSTTPVPGAYMVLANSPAEQLSWEQGNLNYVQLKGYYDHGETLHGNGDYDGGGYNTGGRSWTYNWDDESQTPFLYDSATQSFVSYTDPRGIFYQTCHAARENSKGVMFWEISGDSEDSQLVNAIHAALRGDTLSQYSNQPHCADIIGYGAASSDDDDS